MNPPEQFLLFGDNITQDCFNQDRGFALGAALQASMTARAVSLYEYIRRLDVVNRGYSGYNTDHALEILPMSVPTPAQGTLRLMTVFFGANDANTVLDAGQFVPIDRFKQNIIAIINHESVQAHSPKIILITPPPVEENVLLEKMKELGISEEPRRQSVTKEYAKAVCEVGKQNGVAVLDIWTEFMTKAGWKDGDEVMQGAEVGARSSVLTSLLYDGLHLSPAGYEAVFNSLMAAIEDNWPALTPERIPLATRCEWEKDIARRYGHLIAE